jgi:hypothetical protein
MKRLFPLELKSEPANKRKQTTFDREVCQYFLLNDPYYQELCCKMSSANQDQASAPLVNDGGQSKGAIIKPNFSSLPLQMTLYFGFHWAPFFFVLNICLFVYKGKDAFGHLVGRESQYYLFFTINSHSILLPCAVLGMGVDDSIFVYFHRRGSIDDG